MLKLYYVHCAYILCQFVAQKRIICVHKGLESRLPLRTPSVPVQDTLQNPSVPVQDTPQDPICTCSGHPSEPHLYLFRTPLRTPSVPATFFILKVQLNTKPIIQIANHMKLYLPLVNILNTALNMA